jgi:hypothetical protein
MKPTGWQRPQADTQDVVLIAFLLIKLHSNPTPKKAQALFFELISEKTTASPKSPYLCHNLSV